MNIKKYLMNCDVPNLPWLMESGCEATYNQRRKLRDDAYHDANFILDYNKNNIIIGAFGALMENVLKEKLYEDEIYNKYDRLRKQGCVLAIGCPAPEIDETHQGRYEIDYRKVGIYLQNYYEKINMGDNAISEMVTVEDGPVKRKKDKNKHHNNNNEK